MWGSDNLTSWERFLNIVLKHEFQNQMCNESKMLLHLLDHIAPQLHLSLDSKLRTSSSHCMCHSLCLMQFTLLNIETVVLYELQSFHCVLIFCPQRNMMV